MEQTETERKN